ncbi:MAG TPA: methyltransferase [Candidatus Obscuribacterales bacterium]
MFNAPTLATIGLIGTGAIVATPALYRAFKRRGKGVFYENDYLIQRAPQMATLANVICIALAFLAYNNMGLDASLQPLFTLGNVMPPAAAGLVSWIGVLLIMSGLVFMVGGWYSLGECFSTDAEVMEGQTVKRSGMLKYVMHPAYSGIVQCCLGSSLAAASLPAALIAVAVVAPLWLRRAKYEEKLLLESLGPDYRKYAEDLKWRRLIPAFIPIGV